MEQIERFFTMALKVIFLLVLTVAGMLLLFWLALQFGLLAGVA